MNTQEQKKYIGDIYEDRHGNKCVVLCRVEVDKPPTLCRYEFTEIRQYIFQN